MFIWETAMEPHVFNRATGIFEKRIAKAFFFQHNVKADGTHYIWAGGEFNGTDYQNVSG